MLYTALPEPDGSIPGGQDLALESPFGDADTPQTANRDKHGQTCRATAAWSDSRQDS